MPAAGPAPGKLAFAFPGPPAEADALSRGLAHWIDETGELRGLARLRLVAARTGEQGGAAEAVEIATVAAPVVSAVTTAFFVWLGQRVKNQRVTFDLQRPDGARVKLSAASAAEAAALEPVVRSFLDGGAQQGSANP